MSACLGIDEIVDTHLGLSSNHKTPGYRQIRGCNQLSERPVESLDVSLMLRDMLTCIEKNVLSSESKMSRDPSTQNWRLQGRPNIAPHNTSLEVTLERAMVLNGMRHWVNQVPTASGLVDGTQDKHRNIDLAHAITNDEFVLIELKVESNTPLHAAIECLVYSVLYLFSRLHYPYDMIDDKPLLKAQIVHWNVLAPASYYDKYSLHWLEERVTDGLSDTSNRILGDVTMDFAFTQFPIEFKWPCKENQLISAMADIAKVSW